MTASAREVVFTGPLEARIEGVTVPEPQPGEAVVSVERSLISTGTESKAFAAAFEEDTHWADWVEYPFRPGYSIAGRVTAVGDPDDQQWIGRRITARLSHCSHGLVGVDSLIAVPDDVDTALAPWAKLAQIAHTGVAASPVGLGSRVLVIGAGPIGQMAVRWATAAGAGAVTVVDPSVERHALALAGGATAAISSIPHADEHKGDAPDVVIETSGDPDVLEPALGSLHEGGTVSLLGDPGEPSRLRLPARLTTAGLTVVGVHHSQGRAKEESTYRLFFHLLRTGRFPMDGINTHVFAPDHAQQAYEMLQGERHRTMGVVFDWTAPG